MTPPKPCGTIAAYRGHLRDEKRRCKRRTEAARLPSKNAARVRKQSGQRRPLSASKNTQDGEVNFMPREFPLSPGGRTPLPVCYTGLGPPRRPFLPLISAL